MWPFLVASGISALGSALKMSAALQQGQAAKSIADRNADATLRAAADAVYRGQIATMREQARGDAIVAEQRVEQSGGGIDANTGTNADIATQTQAFTDLDKEFIQNDAMREAYGLRAKAQMQRQEGEYALAASRYEALGALVGGIGRIASITGPKVQDTP